MSQAQSVLLLRGINVGGRNKLPMANLRSCLEALGGQDVETYLQSGNVVATLNPALEETIEKDLSAAIADQHGFKPVLLLISGVALQEAIRNNPFPAADDAPTSVHVAFLEADPSADAGAALDALRTPNESWKLDGRVFYLHAPDGIGRSRLAARAEKAFGCAATSRNWRTIRALESMLG